MGAQNPPEFLLNGKVLKAQVHDYDAFLIAGMDRVDKGCMGCDLYASKQST
jgi:hypothetical protein